jgi:hypothetical protein
VLATGQGDPPVVRVLASGLVGFGFRTDQKLGITDMVTRVVAATGVGQGEERKADTDDAGEE